MAYTHVIFDLDGTILDTLEDLARAANHTCEKFGWPTFSTDAYRYKVGNGMLKLVERFMPAEFMGNSRMFQQAYEEFGAWYAAHKKDHTAPYPGMLEALDALRAAGMTLAVLTNKDHSAAVPLVEHYFGDRFALVQGRIDAFAPKPDPGITRYALDQLGIEPTQALYVGDSNVDVQTGHAAGLATVGVAWGFRGREELAAAGADHIIDTPAELVEIATSR